MIQRKKKEGRDERKRVKEERKKKENTKKTEIGEIDS